VRHSSGRAGGWLVGLAIAAPTVFVAALLLWPLAAVTNRALRPGGELDLSPVGDTLGDPSVHSVLWFTVWQAGLSTLLTVVAALPAAWLFARVPFVGRSVAWAALVVPFVLPTVVVATAISGLPGGLSGRPLAAILVAHVFFNFAVVVRVVGTAWAGLGQGPAEAAAVLGAGPTAVFRRVTLPLLAPSVLAASAVVYLFCFTSFGVVLLLGGGRLRTVEVEIYQRLRLLDLGGAATLALVQLVLVGVLLVVAARWSQRWSVDSPIGGRGEGRLSGRTRWLAVVAGMFTGVLLVVPMGTLVWRSVRTTDGVGLQYWRALGTQRGVLAASPLQALGNSLVVASVATLVALALGVAAVAGLVALERRRGGSGLAAFDAILMLPLGASAVTVGLGLFLAFDRPPLDLRTSVVLVPLAQALVALPFVVRVMLPAARSVAGRLREAAMVCGASPLQVVWHIDRPLLQRPLAVAAGFAFAVAMGEFGATLVVARPDVPTLPIVLARLLGQPGAVNRGQAMAVATLLMVVTAVAVMVADRVGRSGRVIDG
jgi:thiamine transport system permease protein